MLTGWIMLHRKILDNWVAQEPELLAVWVRLLLEANHADTKRMFNGCHIEVKRGQLIYGLNAFSLKSGVSESKVRRYISLLEKDGMISRQKTNKYSLISIVNFDSHQGELSQSSVKAQAENNQSSGKQQHRNNVNNGDNEKTNDTGDKSPTINSQKVVDAYHEILPMMAKVQILNDKRKTAIRNFFKKRTSEKGSPFTMESFEAYLSYIAKNCQWMTIDRPNGKGGFWKAKNFDYILKDDCYIAVKEQRFDSLENN